MNKKLLIVGAGSEQKSALMLQTMKEQYGDDIVLVTPEEAKEQGLKPQDFGNLAPFKMQPPPTMDELLVLGSPRSGREKRRARREKQRNLKKKRRW